MNQVVLGSRLGRYEVGELVGRGGSGSVYRGLDPVLGREVALKVLPSMGTVDPTFVERFHHEAQVAASLSHPNIVQVHDFGEDGGSVYLVTPYLTGGTLESRLYRRMDVHQVVSYVRPIADALAYALSRGVIHRDIKPSNILLDEGDVPVLADFGLAKILQSSHSLTPSDRLLGTPEYLAPEVVLGHRADDRSDLYSVGVLVYRMMLGRTPFSGQTPAATVMAQVHDTLPRPTELDPTFDKDVEAALLKSLAKDPTDRHRSVGELVEKIETIARSTDSHGNILRSDEDTVEFDAGVAITESTPGSNETAKPIKVFLVEDHPLLLEGVRRLLEAEDGIDVVGEATTGEDAVEQLAHVECDVAVVDLALPGISGIEATRRIKTRTPDLNVLILSAYGEQSLPDALAAGADGYMMKTAAPKELRNAIVDVNLGRSPIHPSLTRTLVKTFAKMTDRQESTSA